LRRRRNNLRLWDAVEAAFETGEKIGSPGQDEFGMTVTADEQRVWVGSPEGPGWLLPV
jgi:hypothetical protein